MVGSTVNFDDYTVIVEEEIDSGHEPRFEHSALPGRSGQSVATQELNESRFECAIGGRYTAALGE
jgi:hypothetical protein